MVDVTHLEIPAELAMVYAHLKGKRKAPQHLLEAPQRERSGRTC